MWRHGRQTATAEDLGMVRLDDGRWAVQIRGLWFFGIYQIGPAAHSQTLVDGRQYDSYEEAEWPDRPGRNRTYIIRFQKLKSCSRKEIREVLRIRDERLTRKRSKR
jgi:hypothetical protein